MMMERSFFSTVLLGLVTILLTDRASIVVNAQGVSDRYIMLYPMVMWCSASTHLTLVSGPSQSFTIPPADSVTSAIEQILSTSQAALNQNVFIYQTPDFQWLPSDVFTLQSFIDGLRVMYKDGIANKYFYLGTEGSASQSHMYGVVNIAAFLAQVMKESLQYNACDENNWDLVSATIHDNTCCCCVGG